MSLAPMVAVETDEYIGEDEQHACGVTEGEIKEMDVWSYEEVYAGFLCRHEDVCLDVFILRCLLKEE